MYIGTEQLIKWMADGGGKVSMLVFELTDIKERKLECSIWYKLGLEKSVVSDVILI